MPEKSLMTIRFKCEHCQKPLSVKDHLAGKKGNCPACKKPILIPMPEAELPPIDVEALAAEALADKPVEKAPEPTSTRTIDFTCPFCDEEVKLPFDLGGKKAPCPKCTRVVSVPKPVEDKPKDWRTTQKSGPSAAAINQPEQPDDAWSTAQKSRVSREAMEEAGALPEEPAKPVGIGTWIKRGFWTCVIGGAAFLIVTTGMKARETKITNKHLKDAFDQLAKVQDPLLKAECFRVAGEIEVRNLKADAARTRFVQARTELDREAKALREDRAANVEHDLFLIQLALSQAGMGGSGDETLKRGRVVQRYDWKDDIIQPEIVRTLDRMRAVEARASALRQLACKLIEQDKLDIAIGIAAAQSNAVKRLEAQKDGMVLARKDAAAVKAAKAPDTDKFVTDNVARLAHTEANAYRREYAEARRFAGAKGIPAARLEAAVAGATIALADAKNKDAVKEATLFIQDGLTAFRDLFAKDKEKAPPWVCLEFIRVGSRTDALEEVKKLVPLLPATFHARAQVDIFESALAKSHEAKHALPDEEIPAKTPPRGFAWQALARHNAGLGANGAVRLDDVEEACRPFLHLGYALGERRK